MPASAQWQLGPLTGIKGNRDSPSGPGELDAKFILGAESLSFRSSTSPASAGGGAEASSAEAQVVANPPQGEQAGQNGDLEMEHNDIKAVHIVSLRMIVVEGTAAVSENEDRREGQKTLCQPTMEGLSDKRSVEELTEAMGKEYASMA